MIIIDEVQRLIAPVLGKTGASPSDEAQQRSAMLLQLNPGQAVKAEIVETLPNHRYLARIAGELFQLDLPVNVQPGQTVDLTFVSAEPRVLFQYTTERGGEPVQLSSLGKLLSEVAQETAPMPQLPGPLVEDPSAGIPLLASRLKEVLTQNGLFYEAHLAQWAAGALGVADVLKEPQNTISQTERSEEDSPNGAEEGGKAVVDSRTLPFVREQLLLLQSGLLRWKGEAWPGQEVEIRITRRDGEKGDPSVEAKIKVQMPKLGGVEAKMRLEPEGVSVDLICELPGSVDLLREGRLGLRSALASSGLLLEHMAVKDAQAGE